MLTARSMPVIFNESFMFSLCLKSTRIPKPAFDNNPDITAPKLIDPLIKSIVSAIETAQLGIKPIKAVITGSKTFTCPRIKCSAACLE